MNMSITLEGKRQVVVRRALFELVHGHVVIDQEDGHVADHFAGGRDLDDVAEGQVDLGVGARDFVPARAQAHGFGLLLEIGVLPAGHLVQVDFGRAGLRAGVERRVELAHHLPVIGALVERVEIEAGFALRVRQRGHDGIQIGLAGGAAHRRDGAIGHVHAALGGLQNRRPR